MGFTTITFGGVSLLALEFTQRTKIPGTIKQKNGQNIVQVPVLNRNAKDWSITFRGRIVPQAGSTIDQIRTALEALDNAMPYAYSDGLITGSFIITNGGLNFEDTANQVGARYEYTLSLIQYQQ